MTKWRYILIFSVVGVHLALFFFNFTKPTSPPPKKSLVVNTYTPPPPVPPPPPKRPTQKPPPQRKIQPVKRQPASALLSEKEKILKELRATLTKTSPQEETPPELSLTLPRSIDSLQIDQAEKSQEESDYFLILASSLKEALELPELGKVKLELTLLKSGQVKKVRVLDSESEKNTHYLEQQLKFLRFPPFSEELIREREHTFVLTFCNQK